MTESTLSLARTGDEDAFRELTDPYRRELHLHCHRILGSVQDAEDMVQETLVAAWRGLERYEERGSLRAWLYRIATHRCLNELRERGRRPREAPGLPFEVPEPTRRGEQLWLEPYPDELLEGITESSLGPESRYETKEAVTLAFVAALQQLPPRQRAVLVSRFADAVESGDVEGMVSLLTDDALLTMPPLPLEYQGHDAIARFLRYREQARGTPLRVVPTRANTQPAFGCYTPDAEAGTAQPAGLFVLTLEGNAASAMTWFADPALFEYFGLPRTLRS